MIDENYERVRQIVLKHGWNSTCFQIVNPGIEYWFGEDGESVVGYVSSGSAWVVVGAPVCSAAALERTVADFERDARNAGKRVCYFGAEDRLENLLLTVPDHSKILVGAQPCWDPSGWPAIVKKYGSLRAQLNRAKNKNVVIREWNIDEARGNKRLRRCLHEWLASKGLPPLHFVIEPDTLDRLENRRIFVAEQSETVVGFLLLSPIPNRNGWLTEQFPHIPSAPNGTVELMMDAAMRKLGEEGCDYITLGLSPLSRRATIEPFDNPIWLRVLLAWMRKHFQRFYNFEGLDRFKSKLMPDNWEPIFAISNEEEFSGRTLYAIALAFTENKPFTVAAGGLWRAVSTEITWLKQRLAGSFWLS